MARRKKISVGVAAQISALVAACAIDAKMFLEGGDLLVFVDTGDRTRCAAHDWAVDKGHVPSCLLTDAKHRKTFYSAGEAEAWLDSFEEIPFEQYDLMWMSEALTAATLIYATMLVEGLTGRAVPAAGRARKKRKST